MSDLIIATRVVEALQDELVGQSAFAESPLLRDQIAALVASIEALREALGAANRALAEAARVPVEEAPAPRSYPEQNPLACLSEAAGFTRDAAGNIQRLRDRIAAVGLLLAEAEGAREDAEQVVQGRSHEILSGSMADELQARAGELQALRDQALAAQEDHAKSLAVMRGDLEGRLAGLQEQWHREYDLRRAAAAEGRSLAAEIERLVAGDTQSRQDDDLEVTLGVLREALEAPGVEAPVTAAESVLVHWAELVRDRLVGLQQSVESLRRERDAAQADALAARTQLASAEERARGAGESVVTRDAAVAQLVADLARIRDETGRTVKQRDEEGARLADQLRSAEERLREADRVREQALAQAASTIDGLRREVAEQRAMAASAGGEAERSRAEISQAQDREADLRRAHQQALERQHSAESALERTRRELDEAQRRGSALDEEISRLGQEMRNRDEGEMARQVRALTSTLHAAQERLAQVESRAAALEREAAQARDDRDRAGERAERAEQAATRLDAQRLSEQDASARRADGLAAELDAARTALRQAAFDRDGLASELGQVQAEAQRLTTAFDQEAQRRSGIETQLAERSSELAEANRRAQLGEGERRKLSETASGLERQMHENQGRVADREGRLAERERQLLTLRAELEELGHRLESSEQEARQAQEAAETSASVASSQQRELERLRARVVEQEALRSRLVARQAEMETLLRTAREAVAEVKAALAARPVAHAQDTP